MSDVIVLQHVACETIGTVDGSLAERKLPFRYVRSFEGESVPREMGDSPALIVMGGPMGVYEENRFPFLREELGLIESALRAGRPILGICLGSQLLAKALGAEVKKGPRKEIGWHRVRLSGAGRADAVFGGAPEEFTALHWHGDIFDLPKGAALLASSEMTDRQAFRWGRNAYGILFHLEITEPMLREWVSNFAGELAAEKLDGAAILNEAPRRLEAMRPIGADVFGRWADLAVQKPVSKPA